MEHWPLKCSDGKSLTSAHWQDWHLRLLGTAQRTASRKRRSQERRRRLGAPQACRPAETLVSRKTACITVFSPSACSTQQTTLNIRSWLLPQPPVAEAQQALHRVHHATSPSVWSTPTAHVTLSTGLRDCAQEGRGPVLFRKSEIPDTGLGAWCSVAGGRPPAGWRRQGPAPCGCWAAARCCPLGLPRLPGWQGAAA